MKVILHNKQVFSLIVFFSVSFLLIGISLGYLTTKTKTNSTSKANFSQESEEGKENLQTKVQYGSIAGEIKIEKNLYNSFDENAKQNGSLIVSWCDIASELVKGEFREEEVKYLRCPRENWVYIRLNQIKKEYQDNYIFNYTIDKVPTGGKGVTLLSYYYLSETVEDVYLLPNNYTIEALKTRNNCFSSDYQPKYKQECVLDIPEGKEVKQDFRMEEASEEEFSLNTLLFKFFSSGMSKKELNRWLEKQDDLLLQKSFNLVGKRNNIDISINNEYRQINEILQEGIDNYYSAGGENIFYKRYRLSSDQEKKFEENIRNKIKKYLYLGDYYPDLAGFILGVDLFPNTLFFDRKTSLAFRYSWRISIQQYSDIIFPGSGLYSLLEKDTDMLNYTGRKKRSFQFILDGGELNWDEEFKGMINLKIGEWIREAKNYIENRNEIPVSAGKILGYFLKKNNGNLAGSIWDTAILFKLLTRFDHINYKPIIIVSAGTLDHGPNLINASSYAAQYIKDEYSRVNNFNLLKNNLDKEYGKDSLKNYYSEDPEISLVSRVGIPYHVMNTLALLQYLPSDVIKVLVSVENLGNLSEQGVSKTEVNNKLLLDLDNIDVFLRSFPDFYSKRND